ncbi:MAG: hypothetical protein KC478_05080 [Bacteriovoracaceae bacterium]|nr:hypothetical protein [Bacteriovoracaceae bacterium]
MKVLVISENNAELEQLSRILRNQFKELEVVQARTKQEAMDHASVNGPFGFFALDAEAKLFEPDALGKELIEFTGERPLVFLGSEAFITDRISQELYQSNEYNESLLRPFDREDFKDDLVNKVGNALNFAKQEEFASSIEDIDPEEFIPMKIKGFYLYQSFPYDIYMEIAHGKYIKILAANKPYTINTLANYAKKNVKWLHIRKDDQLEYLETESRKCLKAIRKMNTKSDEMILVLLRSTTLVHQSLLAIGVTPGVLTLCNAITDTIIEVVKQEGGVRNILKRYPHIYAGIASKSLLTGFIATALTNKMGWDSISTKKKLTTAALLMDFTLPEEEMAHINSPASPILKTFAEEDIVAFIQHPLKAAEVAQQFTMFPDIDYLIENHHETPNRKGFPNQPSHTKLTALCSVFNASQFVAAELDGEGINNQLIAKTIRSMSRDYFHGNFKETLKAIKEILKP